MFLIPQPAGAPPEQEAPPAPAIEAAPQLQSPPPVPEMDQAPLHIVCPAGHILETPRDMLGQEAMCPFCQAQFLLCYEASVEYKRDQETRRAQKEEKQARLWMTWAIVAAVVVFGGLIAMMLSTR